MVLIINWQHCIRATQARWRVLREEEKREIPRVLLRKMIRMKMINEGVNLTNCAGKKVKNYEDCLPLPLIELSHRYSISLSTHQGDVETVVEEEWRKQSTIQTHDLYQDDSHKVV